MSVATEILNRRGHEFDRIKHFAQHEIAPPAQQSAYLPRDVVVIDGQPLFAFLVADCTHSTLRIKHLRVLFHGHLVRVPKICPVVSEARPPRMSLVVQFLRGAH